MISRLPRPARLRTTLEEGEASDRRHATRMELLSLARSPSTP